MRKITDEEVESWRALNKEYESSVLKIDEFCEQRAILYNKFKYWRKVIRSERARPAEPVKVFRELPTGMNRLCGSSYKVGLRNGLTLEITDSFVESQLSKLIEILESC